MTVEEFLARRRTWRWNRGDSGGYDAVEATDARIWWYRWSHDVDGGGREDVAEQSIARFRISGPPAEMNAPASVVSELRAWLAEKSE